MSDYIVEADGGSRGNPGPAAYGAVVRDAASGQILAELAEYLGKTTNNVAEYSGLLAALRWVAEHDEDARVEARLDSKLVVEQMSGRWAIKNPGMRTLALQARDVLPAERVTYTWVPRERNKAADSLVNEVLNGVARGGPEEIRREAGDFGFAPAPDGEEPDGLPAARPQVPGWREPGGGAPTTLVVARHGATASSLERRFSGSGGEDPGLANVGWAQARALAQELTRRGPFAAVVASPLRRTRETAQAVADVLGLPVEVEPGLAECAFGAWDGRTLDEARDGWPAEFAAWLGSTAVAPPGGESYDAMRARVDAARAAVVERHAGEKVVLVSHVNPTKILVSLALDAPLHTLYRMELTPCSVTTLAWWPDGTATLQGFAEATHLRAVHVPPGT